MIHRAQPMMRFAVLSIAVVAALLAVLWASPSGGAPAAQANGASLAIAKTCTQEAAVGGQVKYTFTLINTGDVALDRLSVIDSPNVGNITVKFPDTLDPGQLKTVTKFWIVQETDDRPLVNTVIATYLDNGTPVVAQSSCSVDVPHLTITKTATFTSNPDRTTFTFELTNDGQGDLILVETFGVVDSVLGDITSHFPQFLDEGETVVVQITIDGHECRNTVTATYESGSITVTATATCEGGEIGFLLVRQLNPDGSPFILGIVTFHICSDDVVAAGCDQLSGTFVLSVPNPSGLIPLTPGTYTACVVEPAGFVVDGPVCQATQLFDGLTATITFITIPEEPPNGSQLTPTDTDCGEFRDEDAPDLDELMYDVRRGNLSNVVPGVFFYFTKVEINSAADDVTIGQSNDSAGLFSEFKIKDAVVYFDPSCSPLPKNSQPGHCKGETDCTFQIGQTGDFIIRVRYDSKSLEPAAVCPLPLESSTYVFSTLVNVVLTTSDDIDLVPKANAHC